MNGAAVALLLLTVPAAGGGVPAVAGAAQQVLERPATRLRQAAEAKLQEIEAAGEGVFSQDVSGLVAPYFPPGLDYAAVENAARAEGFEPLRPFKGHQKEGIAATYVAEMSLRQTDFESLDLALYLEFVRSDGRLVLRATSAMLRAAYM